MEAVRPHEHAAAKTREPLAGLIELLDRTHRGPDAAVSIPASVSHPDGHAIPVDGDAIGGAPRSPLGFHSPVPDDAIWIGAAVDGLNFLRPASLQRYPHHDRRGEREFRETQNRHYALLSRAGDPAHSLYHVSAGRAAVTSHPATPSPAFSRTCRFRPASFCRAPLTM